MKKLLIAALVLLPTLAFAGGDHETGGGPAHTGPPDLLVLVQFNIQASYDATHTKISSYRVTAVSVAEDAEGNALGETVFEGDWRKVPPDARDSIEMFFLQMHQLMTRSVLNKDSDLKISIGDIEYGLTVKEE